jgi:hypothetical protein
MGGNYRRLFDPHSSAHSAETLRVSPDLEALGREAATPADVRGLLGGSANIGDDSRGY